jgi:hypothetical protein
MRILVVEEHGKFRLYSESEAGRNPAGSWPFRDPGKYPIEPCTYATREAGEEAAGALQAHIEARNTPRNRKRKSARARGLRKGRKGPDLRGDKHNTLILTFYVFYNRKTTVLTRRAN